MFHNNQDALYEPKYIYIWFLLAFQGGFLNTAGFLGVGRFVSHITGFATLFGVEAAKNNWPIALGLLSTPLFFLFGAIFSSWFIERKRIKQQQPRYPFIFFYIVLWLTIVMIAGINGFFGEFGNHLDSLNNFYYLFIVAFICGMQNAMVSSATGNIIRTTHLSGPTTDLGIGLVRIWTFRKDKSKNREFFAFFCRLGIIFSFIVGSFVGAHLLMTFTYKAFLLPIFSSSFSAFALLTQAKKRIIL